MKRVVIVLFSIALIFTMSLAPVGIAYAANGISLEKSPMYVTLGGGITQHLLTASGKIINASKVTWTTSNKKVATVSKKGKVVGLKKGTVTLKAKYKGKTYNCKAYVRYAKKEFSEATLKVGESITQVIYAASGNKASIEKVEFTTANDDIAKVNDMGTITAVSEGTVKIYAKYFGKKYIATITVLPDEKKNEETQNQPQTQTPMGGGGIGGSTAGDIPSKETKNPDDGGNRGSDPHNLINTTYDEYKRIMENGEFDNFRSEFIKKYGTMEYFDWISKMQSIEANNNKPTYFEGEGVEVAE